MAPIANASYFTRDHIQTAGFDAPPELTEQAVHCLELVAELSRAGLSYQFKGGNSLLVLLQNPQRFSIDVDIATDEPRERIEETLNTIVTDFKVFTHWEPRPHKTKPWLPIASYYLYYRSVVSDKQSTSIMLDVQLRRSPYTTEWKQVECGDVYRAEQTTEVPLPASIVGDKLLTLGPRTLGIPVGKGKAAQRIKHVFDVSTLLRTDPNLDDIRESFRGCLRHENELQEREVPPGDILKDTLSYCATVFGFVQKPIVDERMSDELRENIQGHDPFRNHLLSREYPWSRLQTDMARAALCITAVSTDTVQADQFAQALSGEPCTTPRLSQDAAPGIADNADAFLWWGHVAQWIDDDPFAW